MKNTKYCCQTMDDAIKETFSVKYNEKFNEYSIPCFDSPGSVLCLDFCPWCGTKLPDSKRDEWFARLESLGYESPFENFDDIPLEYKTSEWYT